MPDLDQVIVSVTALECTQTYVDVMLRVLRKSWQNVRGSRGAGRRTLNWQIQGCNVVASHLDNLHASVGKPLHLDKTKWNVYNRRRTGRHFIGGAEKICPETNNLP